MQFVTLVRNLFQRNRLPKDWPSSLHNKCDSSTCFFPNPPQAADGTYNCQGFPVCSGTYYVSKAMASNATKNHSFIVNRETVAQAASASTPSLTRVASIKSIKRKASRHFTKSKQKNLPPIPGLHIRAGSLSPGPGSPVTIHPPSTPSTPRTPTGSRTPTTPTSPSKSSRSPTKHGLHGHLFHQTEPMPQPVFGGGKASVSPVASPTRESSQVYQVVPPRGSTRHHVPRSAVKRPYPPRGNASAPSLNMF